MVAVHKTTTAFVSVAENTEEHSAKIRTRNKLSKFDKDPTSLP